MCGLVFPNRQIKVVEKEAEMSSSSSERGGVHHVRTRSSDSSAPSPTSSSKNSTIFSHSNNSKEQQQRQQQQQQQNNGETILIINKAGTNTNSRGQMRKSASMLQFSEHAINQVQGLSKRGLDLPITARLQRRRYRWDFLLFFCLLLSSRRRAVVNIIARFCRDVYIDIYIRLWI